MLTSNLTMAQIRLILESEDACTRCMAHQPELAFDVMPQGEALAQLQIDWYLKGVTIYHD